MKVFRFAFAPVALVVWLVVGSAFAQSPQVWYGKHKAHPTRLLARFKADTQTTKRTQIATFLNERVTRNYAAVPGLVVLEPDTTVMTLRAVAPGKKSPPDLKARIRALLATGAFQYVEPDYEVSTSLTPSDASFADGTLWGLQNTGQNGGVAGADINATAAWDVTTGSAGVIVAVIDSGVRYTHQDLATQMWINPGEVADNGLDDDGDGYVDNVYGINAITGSGDPMDDNDHGTHVAGTIGAAADDGNPHVGVAWSVQIMACKFLDANGSGNTSDAIECINFAVAKGARVLNNSWGGGPFQQALYDAIVNARDQGVLFVAAAGNGGTDGVGDNNDTTPSYPASYVVDNVIAVAAVDRADQLADFSNFGANSVHLAAPGVAIYSSTSGADDEYQVFNGTSMATPHVSGVAALVLAQTPGIGYGELRSRILQGAVGLPALIGKTQTGGRLNALNALVANGNDILEITITSTEGSSVAGGSIVPVYVKVSDLTNVNDATVTGTIVGAGSVTFLNDGVAPDEAIEDGVYSADIAVPTVGTSFDLTVVAEAPGKISVTNTVSFTIRQPPPNNAFANATVIPAGGGTMMGTNVYATREDLEPEGCGGGGKTVWWTWTAPQDQITTIATRGSDFDTVLAVYTGADVGTLTEVDCNDDIPGGIYASEVIFQATAGTTYHLVVDGFSGAEGTIALSLTETLPATNDNFASRTTFPGLNQTVRSSNFGATVEGGEPYHCGDQGGASVWWTWTAPTNVAVSLSTAGSTYDTLLAVYTGADYGSLVAVDCNDDRLPGGGLTSEVSFNAVSGVTYQIAVEGLWDSGTAQTAQGNLALSLVTTPANDDFANRLALNGPFATANGYNIRATRESGEPNHAAADGEQSVWWTWTAPASGNVSVTTWGSTFDTALGVYTGNFVNDLTLVASNDDEIALVRRTSRVSFAATAGTPYHFAVDGYYIYDDWGLPLGTDVGRVALTLSLDGKSRLDNFHLRPDDHYEFTLRGDAGRKYQLESAPNVTGPWTTVGEVVLNGPSSIFIDPVAANGASRFYRAALASLTQ